MDSIMSALIRFVGILAGLGFTRLFRKGSQTKNRAVMAGAIAIGVVVTFLVYYAVYDLGWISD